MYRKSFCYLNKHMQEIWIYQWYLILDKHGTYFWSKKNKKWPIWGSKDTTASYYSLWMLEITRGARHLEIAAEFAVYYPKVFYEVSCWADQNCFFNVYVLKHQQNTQKLFMVFINTRCLVRARMSGK